MNFNQKVFEEQAELYSSQCDGLSGTKTRAPRFHTYGTRKKKVVRRNKVVQVTEHRWEWYREREASRMLHLKDVYRCKMARAINNYFINIFDPLF